MAFRVLAVDSHRDQPNRCSYFAWTDDARQLVGWRVVPDDGDTHFIYMAPVLDGDPRGPAVNIHMGTTGDPNVDPIVSIQPSGWH